jgi:nicotinamidase-related amidase
MNMRNLRDNALLLVIDIQAKLAPHIDGHEQIIRRAGTLLDATALFAIPKLLTEHCPKQIGPVIEPMRSRFAAGEIYEKNRFGAADHPEFVALIRASGRRQIVITGMETHVCVLQTALALRAAEFGVTIVVDAVGSRPVRRQDAELALARMAQAGCLLAGTETVLYEWTGSAVDPQFRNVLGLVKAG